MGWKLARYEFCGRKTLKPNEEREVKIVLKPERKAAIHGVVRFPNGRPAKNAVVKLFKKVSGNPCLLKPITFAFTDECGQFLFGVPSGMEFVIKVFFFKPEHHHHHCKQEMDMDFGCDDDMFCGKPKRRRKPKHQFMDCFDDECDDDLDDDYDDNYVYETDD